MDEPDGVMDGLVRHESYGTMDGVTTSISTSAVALENSSRYVVAPSRAQFSSIREKSGLADLRNGYAVVEEMRLELFSTQIVLQMEVTTLVSVSPQLLTLIPFEELLEILLKVVF